jgi:hypothetical protein
MYALHAWWRELVPGACNSQECMTLWYWFLPLQRFSCRTLLSLKLGCSVNHSSSVQCLTTIVRNYQARIRDGPWNICLVVCISGAYFNVGTICIVIASAASSEFVKSRVMYWWLIHSWLFVYITQCVLMFCSLQLFVPPIFVLLPHTHCSPVCGLFCLHRLVSFGVHRWFQSLDQHTSLNQVWWFYQKVNNYFRDLMPIKQWELWPSWNGGHFVFSCWVHSCF